MKNSRNTIDKRHMQLLQYLREHGSTDVSMLAEIMEVSPITIRRDLDKLEERGLVKRYFGGVSLSREKLPDDEPAYMETTTKYLPEKQAIAKKAADMLEDGDTVFINSSSTAMLIYPYIQEKSVTIVTNNGRSLLIPRPENVTLVLTGGEVNGNKHSLVGQFALDSLYRVTATKCILGVSGISVNGGITSQVIQETSINQTMLKRCSGAKIVVADYTKIGLEHNFFSGTVRDVTHVITDDKAAPEKIDKLRRAGLIVEVVSPEL